MHIFTRSTGPKLVGQLLLNTLLTLLIVTRLAGSVPGVSFAGGSGTEDNPYQIATVEQLQAMREHLDKHFILVADINASVTAGWNSGAGFEPVGKPGIDAQFVGSFNGNSKKITGLSINRPTVDMVSYVGLFGMVGIIGKPAKISNVALEGVNIVGGDNVGGLAGSVQPGSTIEVCYVTGSVSGNSAVGGLIGMTANSTTVRSYATASVSGIVTHIGGLIGFNGGPLISSYATGSVTGGNNVGGLAGTNSGSITTSYAMGNVSGGNVVGGLVGYHYMATTITTSYATGSVSGTSQVGGLVGDAQGTVTHGYWNMTTSGRANAVGNGSSSGMTGLSDSQFKNAASFDGFDFINDWAVDGGAAYPYLRDEPAAAEISPDAAGILYVNKNVEGGNRSGDSWPNAINELSDALQWAKGNWNAATDGTLQIWVAEGKYTPTSNPSDRAATFPLQSGVEIYGGFPNSGTPTMDERNWDTYKTILSGDIGNDDAEEIITDPATQIIGNNSYHVVTGLATLNTAILDGFTITAGNADTGPNGIRGGGISNLGGKPTLTNLAIIGNKALRGGGGMHNDGASPMITDVTISHNLATDDDGGGMYNYGSSAVPVLNHVTIEYNEAANSGGGMLSEDGSSPKLTDVTIRNNIAGEWGGGFSIQGGNPTLTDVVISNNSAAYAAGVMNSADATFTNVTIRDNTATVGQAGGIIISGIESKPVFTDVVICGNSAVTTGGGIHNSGSLATFTNVSIIDNVAANGGGMYSQGADAKLTNVVISGNSATSQGGGLYIYAGALAVKNVVIRGNSATNQGGGIYNASNSTFTNVTISGNAAGAGGGIYSTAGFELVNSIIWNNTAGGDAETVSASIFNYTGYLPYIPSISYSLIANSLDDNGDWIRTIGVNGGNNISGDPQFEEDIDLTDMPTTGGNLSLKATSPAANAGSNDAYVSAGGNLDEDKDVAGNQRLYEYSLRGIIDIGAYESEVSIPNGVPSAVDVSFTGTLKVGATLIGNYTFDDPDADEDKSTFKWYRADDASVSNKAAIDGATEKTYTLQAEDEGKFISFEVTPNDGSVDGTGVESEAQGPIGEAGPVPGSEWALRTPAPEGQWNSVAYGNGLFVAVAYGGTNRVMTSPDGVNWTARTVPESNAWQDITFGDGKFVAVAQDGTNRVMTSTDGVNWDAHPASEDRTWRSVTYGNGKFVAVAFEGGEGNHVMVSENGTDWTSVLAHKGYWLSVTYGAGQFVAVSIYGSNYVMTSPDGENWTVQTPETTGQWVAVTYGADRFVAVSDDGKAMISTDGANWSVENTHGGIWMDVTYGEGQFVAVSRHGDNYVMTSPDGINWTAQAAAEMGIWAGLTHANELFVAVSRSIPSVMTSGTPPIIPNTPPVVSGVTAEGLLEVGGRLSANYTYLDADEDTEASTFTWYRYDTAVGDGGKTTIEGATAATYVLQAGDVDKWISVEVLPSDGEDDGTAVESLRVGPVVAGSSVRFVKAQSNGGTPTGIGNGWSTASSDLQAMIDVLAAKGGGEVWVAAGTYVAPDTSFRMKNGVAIYGGFSGNETELGERNWVGNETILSGNEERTVVDNSYSKKDTLAATAILDGFTITKGIATSAFGGGIRNYFASPILRNLMISGNIQAYKGGGIANVNASPTLINVVLQNNNATSYGGALSSDGDSHPVLINVKISGNFSDGGGGGLTATDGASITLINTVITGNIARGGGGIYVGRNSAVNVLNATISGNIAGDAGIKVADGGSATLQNSLVWGNGPADYEGTISPLSGNNLIGGLEGHNVVNGKEYVGLPSDIFADYQPATADVPTVAGNYQLVGCSPAINAGDNMRYRGGLDSLTGHNDVAGNPRLAWGTVDIGALEYTEVLTPRLTVPADSMYKIGDKLLFTVDFHQPVNVGDDPSLQLTVGNQSKNASVVGTSDNGHEVIFGYKVAEGDKDIDGIVLDATFSYCPVSTVGIRIDGIRPELTVVAIVSNNATASVAKVGNKVALTFTASESIRTPLVTIAGQTATVSAEDDGGLSWKAEYVLTTADIEGVIEFAVSGLGDAAGNEAVDVVATTDGSSVTFYKANPVVTGVTNGAVYNKAVTPIFEVGTATLNGKPYTSGTTITEEGEYTLIVRDTEGNETVVKFTVSDIPVEPGAVPGIPTGLSATAGDRQVKLSWQSPSDGGQPIKNYVIQYSHDGGQTWIAAKHATSADTQAVVIGLDNNRSYRLRVAAENAVGTGVFSAALTDIIPTKPIPNADGELPKPEPGETVVITDGGIEAITLEVVDEEYLRLRGDGYAMELSSLGTNGERIPISAIDAVIRLVRGAGAAVYISGNGFEPGTVVTVYLFSIPELVGHLTVDGSGNFAGTLPVPTNLELGQHTLQANGIVSGGKGERSVSVGLLLVDNKPQTITFVEPEGVTYGEGPVTLGATATSGLPVSYTVTDLEGNATAIASIGNDNKLHIHSAGEVVIAASQDGSLEYAAAAAVSRTLHIVRAPLSVSIQDAKRAYGEANPAFEVSYDGFVSGEDASSLDRIPSAATDATETSVPGSYAITVSGGESADYAFTYHGATLTVVKAGQAITFTAPAEVDRSAGSIQLDVSAGSGLPVTLEVDDEQVATVSGNTLNILRLGTVHITALQAGDGNYEAAEPVTVAIVVTDRSSNFAVRVHPAVSPNGDGINEFLVVEGIKDYPENRVTVISRNGTVLWEASGYDNDRVVFRGISTAGLQLPAGTYFYIVEVKVNGKWEHRKGYFAIRY
ncbi:MBG domain-containing protein [Parapedobacter indicus]|uniref:Gliding motility-associated C-terminal domain-containing protein n=1 Tax=Parapedobacter indicus TaxID=1477437 RepID=A0A1I3PD29_9SPHI|nr:MBG domain-containing protein [Parapedobacter indicus]PPL00412.1 gliding motility-associated-like protein [Parapedobacter indicus]SFJ19299.1 gliding motility-associated C-terminal domain-containing protein [Parapedobacter indicus]